MAITDEMRPAAAGDDERWDAVVRRDRAADGSFYYGVRTTGVYCRPWCASRRPNRANVAFFDDCDGAERAGFRPCKRCEPRAADPHADRRAAVLRACALIESAAEPPSLGELADAAGMSPYHFHRLFKAETGVTPRQYAQGRRAERVREELRAGASVSEAIYSAGYGSSGRFYAESGDVLGMAPATYRGGGAGESVSYAVAPCSLGFVIVAGTERGICAIELGDSPEDLPARLRARLPGAAIAPADEGMAELVAQVVGLIEAPARRADLPLDVRGTAFQRRVWEALRALPPGATASYAEVAAEVGLPGGARAVAQACAANPIAVAIPCHRVVRGDGGLGGYRWGLARKRALLERERAV